MAICPYNSMDKHKYLRIIMQYQARTYRNGMADERLQSFRLAVKETDLWIGIDKEAEIKKIIPAVQEYIIGLRLLLEKHIADNPEFATTHQPLAADNQAASIVQKMLKAAQLAKVGPMAAVAGAVAEAVGCFLVKQFGLNEVVVENGGDLWLKIVRPLTIVIEAGNSPLSGLVGIEIEAEHTPLSVCTSSGTVGHSFSYGRADAAVAVSSDGATADAYATAIGNNIKNSADLYQTIENLKTSNDLSGAIAIIGDKIAIKGDLKLKIIKKSEICVR